MSKLAKRPIILKEGTSLVIQEDQVVVKGPLGEVKLRLPSGIKLEVKEKEVWVKRERDDKKSKANQGTFVRLITNALEGVTSGFSKTLEVVGTGYRAQIEGENLVLHLGYSHPVRFTPPEDIKISVVEGKIKVFGVNKEKVGIVAETIKRFKVPDAYKGKGIRYEGEVLHLKPGKAVAKGAGTGGK